ncbi:MAG: 50S ribosomal protein L22 [Candidatus Harrisonbacteria bacterium RIFCSPLOWO2_02_FULL_45_10c]|uniref:Large ribosomal subunit protein uL22 n=1 Tax=Candidatus Harrisonbacteria bacterium RIFCSPLOWO2_02_FULL_45_10c TaxID=1798410 RepID=A0A1G1ZW30_9BACT|nr:MAG: 50S ribosomal protein L22 [Candidatus Harrisonbacteria bacterium RIFCSPLOWO2_02_FULL_45_10c]
MAQITAKLNYLHIAPRKVRLVASALRGLSVNEAEAQLLFRTQRSSQPLLKLLRSAVANAKYNHKMDAAKLIIENIQVNQGPMIKRFLPRAMGRATPIQKKMSHVVLVLGERKGLHTPRFTIASAKKVKAPKKEKPAKPKMDAQPKQDQRAVKQPGFFKRIFSRKSI